MIDGKQIKKIHVMKKELGMDDDLYRATLNAQYGVNTCKDLTYIQAARFIAGLDQKTGAGNRHTRTNQGNKAKHENLRGRDGMATPRQLRKIEAMWADVSRADTEEAKATALRHFLKRIVGIENLRFLEGWQVKKVINALEAMQSNKQRKEEKTDGITCRD
jgi:phage gp16-like protein